MKLALKTDIDKEVFLELEKGIPITERPFKRIGDSLNLQEEEVFNEIKKYYAKNLIRRFGGVFDINLIGYKSCLCAVKVDNNNLSYVSEHIKKIPHITHCYVRDYPINLWFTFSIHQNHFEKAINELKSFFEPDILLCLPAVKRFKTSVIFDLGLEKHTLDTAFLLKSDSSNRYFTEDEKTLARKLWDFPIAINPFKEISKDLGLSSGFIIDKLEEWKKEKILKRIGIIPFHYNLGYKANIMCAWKVPQEKVDSIGLKVSENRNVTHCYERKTYPEFENNFYAMIHGSSLEEASKVFDDISKEINIENGIKLLSTKEIKKTSLKLFQ